MLTRVLIGVAVAAIAVAVAFVIERRRRASNRPVRDAYPVPRQLRRADFDRPDAPWLVVLFSSSTCDTCATVRRIVGAVESPGVAVTDVEFPAARELHERYEISGVPMVLVADADGVVRDSFVGSFRAEDLTAALERATS